MIKKYLITDIQKLEKQDDYATLKKGIFAEGDERMQVSDGSHTMDELYEHRYMLFIALCRYVYYHDVKISGANKSIWKTHMHSDGNPAYDGYFLLGINKEKGTQISYHLPNKFYDGIDFAEVLDKAPEWDGHTSGDVLFRLTNL